MTAVQNPVFVYVEDEILSRQIVKILLTRVMNFSHLIVFEDSADILSKLATLDPQPNVFFLDIHLDIQMKPYDGFEVLQMLRSTPNFANATIIAMTANVMSHDVESLKQRGFNGLIGKPLVKEVFPQLLEKILDGQSVWFVP